MKQVLQTRLYSPDPNLPPGNCFQACVASILELSIDDVPDEATHWKPGMDNHKSWRTFWLDFRDWLLDRNMGYLEISTETHMVDMFTMVKVPFIATGSSPRGPILHAVVMQYERIDDHGIKPVLIHDPHPSKGGLDGPIKHLGVFVDGGSSPRKRTRGT